jgi:hypothetical protein
MSDSSTVTNADIDKDFLYGVFQAGEKWRQVLSRKAAYKALDIADDDMNINCNNVTNVSPPTEPETSRLGTVAKLAIGLGLVGTGTGVGLGIPLLLDGGREVIERVDAIDNTREVVLGFGVPD